MAVYMYGHCRTFDDTVEAFVKNIIKYNHERNIEVDVFISTWLERDVGGKRLSFNEQEYLAKKYLPKGITFIDSASDDYTAYKNKTLQFVPIITVNISYALKSCHQMCLDYIEENDIEYDGVIITRPDILFKNGLDLTPFVDKKSRGFSRSNESLRLYFPYVLSDFYGQTTDLKKYICGIDLLSIQSFDVVRHLPEWDLTNELYHSFLPEFCLTRYYDNLGCSIGILGYEKDRAFEIYRSRGFVAGLIFSRPIQSLLTVIFYLLSPLLLLSQKFRDKMLFNKHLLDLTKIKKLLTFLK